MIFISNYSLNTGKAIEASSINLFLPEKDLSVFKIENAKKVFQNIKNGGYRGSQEKVFYNSDNFNPTNQWGYEIQISENFEVTDKNRNVELLNNGYIFSGHSDAGYELRDSINVGDFVIYIQESLTAYVFEYKTEYKYAYYIFKINILLTSLQNQMKEDTEIYNKLYEKINEINKEYETAYNKYDDSIIEIYTKLKELYSQYNEITKIDYSKLKYSNTLKLNEFKYEELYTNKNCASNENLISSFEINHEGGYRSTNEIVKYDSSNLIERNEYGYEAAINKNGNVINKGIIISLPEDGYLLSGHGTAKDTINNYLQIGDYIVYENLKVSVYRNINVNIINKLGFSINKLISTLCEEQKKIKPLYYDEIIKKINQLINIYNCIDSNSPFNIQTYKYLKEVVSESLIIQTQFLLIEKYPVQIQSMWHTPNIMSNFYDESTIEGVQKFLKDYSEMGFNRIYLETNSVGTANYHSDILNSHEILGKNYGNYKDYLECFIEEAHKLNIEVIVWVQVLRAKAFSYSETPNVYKEEWLTIDYNGNKCNFLDSTNSEVHNFLIKQFTELAMYNIDGLEYDYIRYDDSNILSYPSNIIDYGYTENSIKMFKSKYNFDESLDIKEILKDLKARIKWVEFKKQRITDLLISAKSAIRLINPKCILTAAVFSSINAPDTVMQNWPQWLNSRIIDYVEPMIYEKDTYYFLQNRVPNFLSMVYNDEDEKKNKVIIGVGTVCAKGDYMEYLEQIKGVMDLGHSYNIFSTYYFMIYSKFVELYKNYNYSPISYSGDKEKKVRVLVEDLKKKIEEYYSKVVKFDFGNLKKALESCLEDSSDDYINKVFEEINLIDNENVKNNIYNVFMKVNSKYDF